MPADTMSSSTEGNIKKMSRRLEISDLGVLSHKYLQIKLLLSGPDGFAPCRTRNPLVFHLQVFAGQGH